MNWFTSLISGIAAPVVNLFTKRNENKTNIKLKQIDRLKNSDDSLAEWESIQAENGRFSWKDEFWTIVLAIPLVLCFFPDYVGFIKEGFSVLEEMPEFYQYWLGVAILTSFGIKFTKR
ncbi:MAG TPA: hypothetical protein EYN67_16930 [Flavobacteriales bacterium]|nr:hypothetical protein [Methylococcaceae bacterium]HHZ97185.1 hypothetical protein [Flavobacteriales bacterium]